ncbi:FUSC family protein [Sphingomonas naphthae]|uniref:FUSC family protein n=1 Tax=Sphingomonas naphthae TaxID=1813468 RepID=A0ABY7TJV8_9SPHN|nr:FUSC family protein [Sphingomonas naphthae]WCT73002.1 FUSC family protein [Sphingomonas naphthae]
MTDRFGWAPALFSLKCFVAAMLALFVALSIGLERPYWAFLTSYIVAQPLAGAVISKAVYRVIGTIVGGAMAVLMVPPLVNSPELLTLAMASWLGLCVFVSLLDRTPRAYMFVLAGYSACLIVFPSVETPDQIFTVAVLRAQEIIIGIACGSLVHSLILPGSVTDLLFARVATILRDAERWSRDSLGEVPAPTIAPERQRLAQDVLELHQLSSHLPFDISRLSPRVQTVRALQDQLALLLPLGAAVDDRLATLRQEGPLPAELAALIVDVRDWLGDPGDDAEVRHAAAEALRARCTALEPDTTAMGWRAMLRLSLLARLSRLIAAHRDCRDLKDQMLSHSRRPVTPRVATLLEGQRGRPLHRDYAGALRGAIGAFITIVVGCALWIGSGSAEFSTSVMLAGVFLALFSATDDPVLPLKGFMIGTGIATLVGLLYGFVILPRIDGFPMLAAAMAPMLLIGGTMMAMPRTNLIALAAMLGLGSPALLADRYLDEFAIFTNAAIAQLVGVWFAIVMAGLLGSAGAEGAIRRIIRAGWADIAARSNVMAAPDLQGWINRMLDRLALLAPRLAARGRDSGRPIYDALRDMRSGVAIGELRQLRLDLPPADRAPVTHLLEDVGAYYGGLDPDAPKPAPIGLLAHIDAAMARLAGHPDAGARRTGLLALLSLRRNLFPSAAAYRSIAA